MTERRAARRYDLSLSAVVRVPSGVRGSKHQGTTRDVSTRGVYLILDRPVSRETDVDLTMVLPTNLTGGVGVFVRAVGKIVRVEEWSEDGNRRAGVATVIRRYEIVRNEPAVPSSPLSRSL
jgi:PilZ domain-containing protein